MILKAKTQIMTPPTFLHSNNGKTFLMIPVPEDCIDFSFVIEHGADCIPSLSIAGYTAKSKNQFDFQFAKTIAADDLVLIGKASELSEEQAGEIVPIDRSFADYPHYGYPPNGAFVYTALQSIETLCKAHSLIPSQTLILQKI